MIEMIIMKMMAEIKAYVPIICQALFKVSHRYQHVNCHNGSVREVLLLSLFSTLLNCFTLFHLSHIYTRGKCN